jgi:microsomal epoxide hydrolase
MTDATANGSLFRGVTSVRHRSDRESGLAYIAQGAAVSVYGIPVTVAFRVAMVVCSWIAATCVAPACAAADSLFFTTSDGVRLHYTAQGEGETLLFVPGWLMPGEIWARQADYFARNYRVVAFDPRSQGDSQLAPSGNNIRRRAQDLHELIEHLGSKRVVLVAWSLGVMESLLYIHTYGDGRIAALVFVDNSIGELPPQTGGTTIPARVPWTREGEMADFVRAIIKSPQPPEYLAQITASALRAPPETGRSLLAITYPRTFWRSVIYHTRKPLLYAVTPSLQGQAESLLRKRKRTSIEVFADAGHALFVDEPGRFNAVLAAFLDRTLAQ